MRHEDNVKKQGLIRFAFKKSNSRLGLLPIFMMTQVYSFEANSMVTIMTGAQLKDLISERRARGCSEVELSAFENWHLSQLNQN